jgi:hypothetical protein
MSKSRNSNKKEKPIELVAKGRGKMPRPSRILDERATRKKRLSKKELRDLENE